MLVIGHSIDMLDGFNSEKLTACSICYFLECFLACQSYISWKAAEPCVEHYRTILIDVGGCGFHRALLFVFLTNSDGAGDRVANVDRGDKLELHRRREE